MSTPLFNTLQFPFMERLRLTLGANHRFIGDSVNRGYSEFGEKWGIDFEQILRSALGSDSAIAAAAKGYAAFSLHSMRLQAAFEREGRYRATSHKEASIAVYDNRQHMLEEYLPGLLLSHYLWPHHYRQLAFFESAFVGAMRAGGAKTFLEIGVGTGIYSAVALRNLPNVLGTAVDISPWSRQFSNDLLASLGFGNRFDVNLRDIVAVPRANSSEWIICVEVLEHLDDPISFLRAVRNEMRPGARGFITAAINAAHADHVYLYRSASEVLAHLRDAGFSPLQWFVAPAYQPKTRDQPIPEAVAVVVSRTNSILFRMS